MGDKTGIEWTDATWNPLIGCSLKSDGCKNCYAMKVAHRFQGTHAHYAGTTKLTTFGPHWTGKINQAPMQILDQPLRWTRPRMIFVNSMSDLFHEDVSFEFIAAMFGVMAACPQHKFQVLTKRPERMLDFFKWIAGKDAGPIQTIAMHMGARGIMPPKGKAITFEGLRWPLDNVWLGTSIESQKTADERLLTLLQVPAVVRWVSAEPLLGPVKLGLRGTLPKDLFPGYQMVHQRLHWVVVGGESGPKARPMAESWAQELRAECADMGVPFLFKQWGDWQPVGEELDIGAAAALLASRMPEGHIHAHRGSGEARHTVYRVVDGQWMRRVGKKKAGRQLGGELHDGYPQPEAA